MVEAAGNYAQSRLKPLRWSGHLSLTSRILAVNILPLALLGGGIFYLDTYRTQLLTERYKLARIEAQITAEALAGATRQRQEALLVQIGKEQRMRLRMYDAEGRLWADSFALDEPPFSFKNPAENEFEEDFARALDNAMDAIVGAEQIPPYIEPEEPGVEGWPELQIARAEGLSKIELRQAPDGSPVINVAAPVGLRGSTLLTTRNAIDITEKVRSARSTLGIAVMVALLASILLSLFLARTIVLPLRSLASSAVRVRQGREREVEVPRLPDRNDEIGLLARAVSDMTSALRHRIDAVDSFAADVAHEIKNPLASLRSALESLPKVEDPALRNELTGIAAHDVRRIDRLVSEISEASRVEAEISRATLERIDLSKLVSAIVGSRESRDENQNREIIISATAQSPVVIGVAARLERVVENLLDNAVSFSPAVAPINVYIENSGQMISLTVSDHGPGIPEDAREKVFQRFHSVRPEEEAFGNHSGLGLAIARSIAEAHDGTLTAHARDDGAQGACLKLQLPAAAR
ncbi:MAG TPA: sensor histidine kinase [Erythrobacter sp.]|nr:sensor histidine kinase [Erythrobacter sp.]